MKQELPDMDAVNRLLSEAFEVSEQAMHPDADLRRVLELDSLDYIDLVVVIENNFSFKVKPEDFTQIFTFRDFHSYISSRMQPKESNDAFLAGQIQG